MILGGLVTSTLLCQIVTPALFWLFDRREWGGVEAVSARENREQLV